MKHVALALIVAVGLCCTATRGRGSWTVRLGTAAGDRLLFQPCGSRAVLLSAASAACLRLLGSAAASAAVLCPAGVTRLPHRWACSSGRNAFPNCAKYSVRKRSFASSANERFLLRTCCAASEVADGIRYETEDRNQQRGQADQPPAPAQRHIIVGRGRVRRSDIDDQGQHQHPFVPARARMKTIAAATMIQASACAGRRPNRAYDTCPPSSWLIGSIFKPVIKHADPAGQPEWVEHQILAGIDIGVQQSNEALEQQRVLQH